MDRTGRLGMVAALALVVPARPAGADPVFEGPIVDNNYAIDFYEGVAIGNTAQVGGSMNVPPAPLPSEQKSSGAWR